MTSITCEIGIVNDIVVVATVAVKYWLLVEMLCLVGAWAESGARGGWLQHMLRRRSA
jgi:hypothetical protein